MFRFVIEQTKAHGKRPDLQTLFERWNEQYPQWRYKKAKYPKSP